MIAQATNMKKKPFYSLAIGILLIFSGFLYWQNSYSSKIDFRTAYNEYIENGCESCLSFFEQIGKEKIPDLEKELAIGVVSFMVQAHISDGYYDLSREQKEENARIEKLALLFLEKGADINYVPQNSRGALFYAVTSGNSNLVKFLLENGADAGIENHTKGKKTTALDAAKEGLTSSKGQTQLNTSMTKILELIEKS